MAELSYLLEYADIPFVSDVGKLVRINFSHAEQKDPDSLPPRKHQPLADLVDELDRLIPFCYLSDFKSPSAYPGRNLGAIARLDDVGPQPDPRVRIGDWYYPTGAQRWSVFRGLATSTMAKQMLAATGGISTARFVMQANPITPHHRGDAAYTVETYLYMLPPRPLAELGGSFDGLFLITLVDDRYYWQNTPSTLRVTKDSTWAGLLTTLASDLGITLNYSAIESAYSQPEPDSQLWANSENAAVLLDALAHNVGRTVVRNMDGTISLLTAAESAVLVATNRGAIVATVDRTAGGDIFSAVTTLPAGNLTASKNAVIPDAVRVTFPKYVAGDDPVPHFLNARYANQRPSCWYEESYGEVFSVSVPISSGGPATVGLVGQVGDYVLHDTAKALYDTEASAAGNPTNNADLHTLAMKMAQDVWNWQLGAALDETYPGTVDWTPEGFHDIVWTYSERSRKATTRVMRSEWNQLIREFQHSAPAPSATLTNVPKGVGGPSVAQSQVDVNVDNIYSVTATIASLTATATTATFNEIDNLPTQNRWKGLVDDEVILFEGTSGGTSVGIVYRGYDGTVAAAHAGGSLVTMQTSAIYGVNLVRAEKMQYLFPQEHTSGGIQAVNWIPQTQTVYIYSASGAIIGGVAHYSGRVQYIDPTAPTVIDQELCWVLERNNDPVISGKRFDGQFAGFSRSGTVAPLYVANIAGSGVSMQVPSSGINALKDSYDDIVTTTLTSVMASGASTAAFAAINSFPTQNRWVGQIESEKILFEGTSGGATVNAAVRGFAATSQVEHAGGSTITWVVPDRVSGHVVWTHEKGQFIFPGENQGKGTLEGVIVPQTQTVRVVHGTPVDSIYYSGVLQTWDVPSKTFENRETVWIFPRNSGIPLVSGRRYDGQLMGFSPLGVGAGPTYVVDERSIDPAANILGSGQTCQFLHWSGNAPEWIWLQSGVLSGVITSGYLSSGYDFVYPGSISSGDLDVVLFNYITSQGMPDVHAHRINSTVRYERWYFAGMGAPPTATATATPQSGWMYAMPIITPRAITLDRLAVQLTDDDLVDTSIRLSLYNNVSDPEDLYPGTLLNSGGVISAPAVGAGNEQTFVRAVTINQTLEGNSLYWLAFQWMGLGTIERSANPTTSWHPAGAMLGISGNMGSSTSGAVWGTAGSPAIQYWGWVRNSGAPEFHEFSSGPPPIYPSGAIGHTSLPWMLGYRLA